MIKLIKSTYFKEPFVKKKLTSFIQNASYLSFGEECQKFEKAFATWQHRRDCVMVNSGSSANLAIIQALINLKKLKKGDKVGFSAITWSTNVMPLIQLGLEPVPIDVELATLNVSDRTLEKVLKKHKLKAVFLTNLLGFCDAIDQIRSICRKNNSILLEDNCESLGSIYKGKLLGNFGLASTFSFYVGHHLSTIEGGAICTNNAQLADMLRIVRAHGWDRNLATNTQSYIRKKNNVNSPFYSRYTFYDLGYNFRPTEINGFIGRLQLDFIDEIIKKRQENFLTIAAKLYARPDTFHPLTFSHLDRVSNFAIPVICMSEKMRDELVEKCNGVLEIRPIVGGDITEQPFFKKYIQSQDVEVQNARLIHRQGFYFGNNPELTAKEINTILSLLT